MLDFFVNISSRHTQSHINTLKYIPSYTFPCIAFHSFLDTFPHITTL